MWRAARRSPGCGRRLVEHLGNEEGRLHRLAQIVRCLRPELSDRTVCDHPLAPAGHALAFSFAN